MVDVYSMPITHHQALDRLQGGIRTSFLAAKVSCVKASSDVVIVWFSPKFAFTFIIEIPDYVYTVP